MSTNLVRVYSTGTAYLAELLKQVLFDNEIESFIINHQDSSYLIGDVEVHVKALDIEKAKTVVEEFEKNTSIE